MHCVLGKVKAQLLNWSHWHQDGSKHCPARSPGWALDACIGLLCLFRGQPNRTFRLLLNATQNPSTAHSLHLWGHLETLSIKQMLSRFVFLGTPSKDGHESSVELPLAVLSGHPENGKPMSVHSPA